MIYTLFVWAVIAMGGDQREYGWQVLGEFYHPEPTVAQVRCTAVALELELKNYKCVRTR